MLEMIYGVSLENFELIFSLLLLGGGVSAINNYYSVVITVLRKQRYLIIAYGVGLLICLLTTNYTVKNYMLLGAAWSFGCVMIGMFSILSMVIILSIRKLR